MNCTLGAATQLSIPYRIPRRMRILTSVGGTMPHYGVLRDYKFEDIQDVRGAEVYGVNNEKLGTIDDVIFDHSTGEIRYAVINAGSWLSGKRFLVPINRIEPYGNHEDKFYAELDKERIQMLPEFKEDAMKSEAGWTDYEKRYQERWNDGTVMYNKDTGHIVTPPLNEVQGTRTTPLSEEGKRSLQKDFTPEKMGKRDEYLGVGPTGDDVTLRPKKASIAGREDAILQEEERPSLEEPGIYRVEKVPEAEQRSDLNAPLNANYGRRWIDFQQRLRAGRDKVVAGCPMCGTQKKVA
ncbi:MAG TPA: PRC-barrel domain-containing protein [Candidatus Angelobacter sp.]